MIPPKPASASWTDKQWQAIYARPKGLLLAAAAGSGKTAVLIERIMSRLIDTTHPVTIDQLLVTTFTEAAAAEMRHRLRSSLELRIEQLERDDTDETAEKARNLRRQLNLLPRAMISTLHAFCKNVLQRYFYRIGLDPSFRIANETDLQMMRQDVLESILDKAYEDMPKEHPFWQLTETWGGRSDDRVIGERILALYDQARSQPWPKAWLFSMLKPYETNDLRVWIEPFRQQALDLTGAWLERIEQVYMMSIRAFGQEFADKTIKKDRLLVESFHSAWETGWKEGLQALQMHVNSAFKWPTLSFPRDGSEPQMRIRIKGARDDWKKRIGQWIKKVIVLGGGAIEHDIAKLGPLLGAWVEITIQFDEAFQAAKAEKSWIDFSDLEHLCLKILCKEATGDVTELPDTITPTDAAIEIRKQLAEVMVDEYQDTNRVQETIITLLCEASAADGTGGSARFMVGDVKQSIYRFRLAEPGLFLEHERNYVNNDGGARIVLSNNFRSRTDILYAVNGLFRQLMGGGAAEISYDAEAELRPGNDVPEGSAIEGCVQARTEIVLIQPASDAEFDEEVEDSEGGFESEEDGEGDTGSDAIEGEDASWQAWSRVQREAAWIARRILHVMGMDRPNAEPIRIFDPHLKDERPLRFSDITVLLRSTSSNSMPMIEAFRKAGIPADADIRENWFEAPEVLSTLSLLEVLDNRKQDIPLAATLRSAYFSWDEDGLTQIRLVLPNGDFHLAHEQAIEQAAKLFKQGQSIAFWQEKLLENERSWARWSELRHRVNVVQLLWQIWEDTGFYALQAGLSGGPQRQANLRAMTEMAAQADTSGEGGLYRFLLRMRRIRRDTEPVGAARLQEDGANQVRVMSIHKSKGLEFPVVFVALMASNFNASDHRAPFMMHRDLGVGVQYLDPKNHVRRTTLPLYSIRTQSWREQLAEELRILYVALTRAREHLILVVSPKRSNAKHLRWDSLAEYADSVIPFDYWLDAKCYWDWLAPALVRHRSATPLREWMGTTEPSSQSIRPDDEGKWLVTMVPPGAFTTTSDIQRNSKVDAENVQPTNSVAVTPDGKLETLSKHLTWKYPFEEWTTRFSKVTVSKLKELTAQDIAEDAIDTNEIVSKQVARGAFRWELPDEDVFRPNNGIDGKMIGTLVHQFMQRVNRKLDWDAPNALQMLNDWIGEQTRQQGLDALAVDMVDASQLLGFLRHDLGKQFRAATRVWREQPFSLSLDAVEVYPELSGADVALQERVLVQGIIDLMWQDEQGIFILDYKTDRFEKVSKADEQARKEAYLEQISWYRRAVEESTGMKVQQTYLFFLQTGEVVSG